MKPAGAGGLFLSGAGALLWARGGCRSESGLWMFILAWSYCLTAVVLGPSWQ